MQKINAKSCLSEMGFEPMPSSRTRILQSLLRIAEQGLCLESGALDHSAILTSYCLAKQFATHLGIEPRTFGLEVQRAILCANGSCWHKKFLAERSFDLRTSGLWAQHASTAPLCYTYLPWAGCLGFILIVDTG